METEWERLEATRTFLLLADLLTTKILDHGVRDEFGRELSWLAKERQAPARVRGPAASRRMDVEGDAVMSGSIRSRSKGSWELKFEAGVDPATGKRKTVYRTVKGTKRQAEAKLVELQSEAVRNGGAGRSQQRDARPVPHPLGSRLGCAQCEP